MNQRHSTPLAYPETLPKDGNQQDQFGEWKSDANVAPQHEVECSLHEVRPHISDGGEGTGDTPQSLMSSNLKGIKR